MGRILRALPLTAVLVGASLCIPTMSSADTVPDGYSISVSPTAQLAGQSVSVTGDGQAGDNSDNCDSTTITVTVTYFTLAGTQTSAQTDFPPGQNPGEVDGDGDFTGPVTIPAGAAPTSVSGHSAEVQASCVNGDSTFESNVVDVTVEGTVTPTTVPVTTTTVPNQALQTAPAATAVTGAPQFTG
jgi:hypothetical protein